MEEIIINEVLLPALQRLYQVDYENILYGVSERNICARLALHMENFMRQYDSLHEPVFQNYYADVEYNRMGKGDLKMYENSDNRLQYMVSDLLVHSRGKELNYLAVEVKRKGNNRHVQEDMVRLASMVSSSPRDMAYRCVHNTSVGAFIVYGKTGVTINLFENINGKGQQTKIIILSLEDLCKGGDINNCCNCN